VPEAHYHIGMSLFRSKKKEAGRQKMMYVAKTFPQTSWAKYAAERLKEHSSHTQNINPDIHTGNLDYYMGKALNFFNHDQVEKAKPILQEISDRYPGFAGAPQALAALALCYYKEGDCQNTIKNYKKLISRYPAHGLLAEAYFHLGVCYERTGNQKLAEDAFRKVVNSFPDTIYAKQASEILSR
jgi:TolA-binding protein